MRYIETNTVEPTQLVEIIPLASSTTVCWLGADGFSRSRTFACNKSAETFATQLRCRLGIDLLREEAKRNDGQVNQPVSTTTIPYPDGIRAPP